MSDVKEGFLCPICMSDLGDVIQLQVHFEEKHSKEDPIFLQNIKDLFGKAKKKILNQDEEFVGGGSISGGAAAFSQEAKAFFRPQGVKVDHDPVSGVHNAIIENKPDRIPTILSHTEFFKKERKKRLERNMATNQVLMRLEKLLKNIPVDPVKRRAHEQTIVPWINEDNVKLCPTCARQFNVARRKHHCRLCGTVLCNDCSTAISFDFAKKVINPHSIAKFGYGDDESDAKEEKSKKSGLLKSKFGGSHESINSLMNLMDLKMTDPQFRSCHLCREILDRQDVKLERSSLDKPILLQFYDRLQQHMAEGRQMEAQYREMVESLFRGEEEYRLKEVEHLRVRLLKVADNIDTLSKKIACLNTDPNGSLMISPMELKLQQRIRMSAVNFIKECLVALPGVPTEEEHERLKRQRVENTERKVEEEKQAAKFARIRYEQQKQEALRRTKSLMVPSSNKSDMSQRGKEPSGGNVNYVTGFVLSSSKANYTSSDDPMVQQINNLKEYIAEAKRLGKKDEVASLEQNLREFQAEYQRQMKERHELEENFNSFKGMFHKTSPSHRNSESEFLEAAPEEKESSKQASDESKEEEQEFVDMDEYDASGMNPFF